MSTTNNLETRLTIEDELFVSEWVHMLYRCKRLGNPMYVIPCSVIKHLKEICPNLFESTCEKVGQNYYKVTASASMLLELITQTNHI